MTAFSSSSCGPALWNDGCSYDGQAARAFDIASRTLSTGAAQVRGGVLPAGGALAVTAGSGMSVNVATGYAVCASSTGSTYGGYLAGLMSAVSSLGVATSDTSNPRIDAVYAYVTDDGTSASSAYVGVFTGTPAPGANLSNLTGRPAAPGNDVLLACILVPANSTSVSGGNILDARAYTVAQGGILPVPALTAPAGYTGALIYDTTSGSYGSLKHNPASGPVQVQILPFATQVAFYSPSGTYKSAGTVESYLSVSVTTDGNTDIDIYGSLSSWSNPTSGGTAFLGITLDGTVIWNQYLAGSGGGTSRGGASFTHRTRSGTDRPTAATHTIALTYNDDVGSTGNPTSFGTFELRVSAAVL
jgi:hypothetical protein